ncbi:cupin domain-containing protein [Acinetobacter nectaris]|uniref:ribosomal protein uL16 3-hydroxylase n=1 Tax=Acinetobacter nectaris TaxID=1219382 RepID=UPI001F38B296|nr:cupin domain-containing protein [Acinetobacter nectaris]MCF9046059.1 cupin domain-containing protein [Acinetobacter nectaris]
MSQPLTVLGNITAEQFLREYWQKKPLLVRQAIPEIANFLEPEDIQSLALEDTVTARLIQQTGKNHDQWQVKSSPLEESNFKNLPPYWTLLVQAVDHYSMDLAELWKKFHFIPQWRRDDIMVSYAPKGGSVGKHFDFYDVFLVQGFGHRRWQLGQRCNENTQFIEGQPLKLLSEMEISFDEVLAPGDLLYVPPGLSHYGVAEDECLTYSFGFRMPNLAGVIDRISDQFADNDHLKNPIQDTVREHPNAIGEITAQERQSIKKHLLEKLMNADHFDHAIMALMSEPKYPDNIPESDEIELEDLNDLLDTDYSIQLEPASRLLYLAQENTLKFWANGESLNIAVETAPLLKKIADGDIIYFSEEAFSTSTMLEDILPLINDAILMLTSPEEE